jgi:hypothetical protein
MRQMATQYSNSTYDPRFHMRHVGAESVMRQPSQYSPPQVRSGRGSLRLPATSRAPTAQSPANTPAVHPSFPVSNRGKGRKNSACRSAIPAANAAQSTNVKDRSSPVGTPVTLAEAQRIGGAVHGVAVAVSRKTKRKLPLARKVDADAKN